MAPSPPQTDEDYIVIAKRIMAATQSGDSSPAVRFMESNRTLAATQSSDSSTAVRFTVSPPNGNNINISSTVFDDTASSGDNDGFSDDEISCYVCCYVSLCYCLIVVAIGIFVVVVADRK